ncbi:FecR family protein [Pedobacter africanus]|uniref:FecR family protein n=1 Tax=Pedobacter africanus TaxID=151894 RepID=A0A1W2CRM3_9SPHI|nr:FecR family protein [Pedobacter africanus]SMC87626.1 FecR family protein [Pedobacter africanus]
MAQFQEIEDLILKFLKKEISPEEESLLQQWIDQDDKNKMLFNELTNKDLLQNKMQAFHSIEKFQKEAARKELFMQIGTEAKVVPINRFKRSLGWIAAAVVIGVAAIAIIMNISKDKMISTPVAAQPSETDVAPRHDGAVLTLASGKTIVLDDVKDGKLTDIAVKNRNQVSYVNGSKEKVELNTMTTPKGKQFSLVLGDGTKVWLNAASSITYPTAFVGNERKVDITGEVYFEVTHDAKKPFNVTVNGMNVQVLGTHFNINSYGDQGSIKTTLLQGSIKVSIAGKTQMIKPGQQAQVSNENIRVASNTDVAAVMAWKNGFFSFEGVDVKVLMKEISRWYDVEVIYQGEPKDLFSGEIDRNLTLTQVLKGLADTKVRYRIEEGKKLIILP